MEQLPLVVDRLSPVPLYHQLAEQFTTAIADGVIGPGDLFETELSLASRLRVSRPTVRRAIAELVDRGLLVRRRGVGTTVANRVIHRRDELTSLHDDLLRRGQKPRTEVLEITENVRNAPAAAQLGLSAETPFLHLVRRRLAGRTPAALLNNYLPPAPAQVVLEHGERALRARGLYDILRSSGIRPVIAHQVIGARRPVARERRLLDLVTGDPLLTMTRRAYDAQGDPVEFGDHCYRYDQYAFEVTVHDR